MKKNSSINFELKKGQQEILLSVAKEAIKAKLFKKNLPKYDFEDEIFREKRGAFVTLHKFDKLRGCIGYIVGIAPLLETIRRMAIAAAFEDPRFPPLDSEEFEHLNIEISVLTPITKVKKISEIEIGKDGLIVKNGFYQGLLLPQVAEEENWDVEEFLQHTCLKAGLHPDAWKDDETTIEKFSAQIFGKDISEILDTKQTLQKFYTKSRE